MVEDPVKCIARIENRRTRMKFKLGQTKVKMTVANLTRSIENQKLMEWHPFFAIIPRQVAPGEYRCLETIERKGVLMFTQRFIQFGRGDTDEYWIWEYRAKESPVTMEGGDTLLAVKQYDPSLNGTYELGKTDGNQT